MRGTPWITPGLAYDLALTRRSAKGFTGTVPIHVDHAGTYRVALGAKGWIDVKQHDKSVTSTAHAHGPACSGIAKIVDFPLHAGDATITVDELAASPVRLMVADTK